MQSRHSSASCAVALGRCAAGPPARCAGRRRRRRGRCSASACVVSSHAPRRRAARTPPRVAGRRRRRPRRLPSALTSTRADRLTCPTSCSCSARSAARCRAHPSQAPSSSTSMGRSRSTWCELGPSRGRSPHHFLHLLLSRRRSPALAPPARSRAARPSGSARRVRRDVHAPPDEPQRRRADRADMV